MRKEGTMRREQEPRRRLTVMAVSYNAGNLDFIPGRLTCHDGVRDVFHTHVPIAPFPSIDSSHTGRALLGANAIYYEDYLKSLMKLSLKAK